MAIRVIGGELALDEGGGVWKQWLCNLSRPVVSRGRPSRKKRTGER